MTKLGDIILRNTRANQPAFGTEGRLYYVTDENVTERDSGSAWEDISDAGTGGGGGGSLTERVRAYHNANQSVATATPTTLAFNSERWDTDTCHDNATNNSRLTCGTTGSYLIGLQLLWDQGATPSRSIAWILLNGTDVIAQHEINVGSTATNAEICMTTQYDLTAGDYLQALVYQNSGVSINVVAAAKHSPEFWMTRVQ